MGDLVQPEPGRWIITRPDGVSAIFTPAQLLWVGTDGAIYQLAHDMASRASWPAIEGYQKALALAAARHALGEALS